MKPTTADCINANYSSIAWEMEQVYLDTIRKACTLRNIKLMIGIIPLMFKLNEDYPIAKVHSKLAEYCEEKDVDCIDFLEMGLKGRNASELVFSDQDKHLNADGAEIIANSLYKKLEPLTTYNHLPVIHRAFSLEELLGEDEISKGVDRAFAEIKGEGPDLTLSSPLTNDQNKIELKVWKSHKNYFFSGATGVAGGMFKTFRICSSVVICLSSMMIVMDPGYHVTPSRSQ